MLWTVSSTTLLFFFIFFILHQILVRNFDSLYRFGMNPPNNSKFCSQNNAFQQFSTNAIIQTKHDYLGYRHDIKHLEFRVFSAGVLNFPGNRPIGAQPMTVRATNWKQAADGVHDDATSMTYAWLVVMFPPMRRRRHRVLDFLL